MLKSLVDKIGLDAITTTTLVTRVWTTFSGLVLLGAISYFLTPFEQGVYYLFVSMLAAQVLLELGLSFTLAQFTSHEFAYLSWSKQNFLEGDFDYVRKVLRFFKFALVWYFIIAVLMLLIIFPVGIIFIGQSNEEGIGTSVLTAWGVYVVVGALNMIVNPLLVLLEACGRVLEVAKIRLAQAVLSTALILGVFYYGGGIFGLSAGLLGYVGIGVIWLTYSYSSFLKQALSLPLEMASVFKMVISMQWRIAISWAFGYLTFYTFTPMVFYYVGGIESGQYGMSMQIFVALNSLGVAWITTKMPIFCKLIQLKKQDELNQRFYTALAQSSFVMVAINLLVLFILGLDLNALALISSRILSWKLMALLCIASILNHLIFSFAAIIRAQKIEPMMVPTVIGGLVMIISGWLFIPVYGAEGAVWIYLACTCLGFVMTLLIFKKHRKFVS